MQFVNNQSTQPVNERRIKNYIIGERIGEGCQGSVFKAYDTILCRTVALKVLSQSFLGIDQNALKRFLREAQLASKINHVNVAQIYQVDSHNGIPYISQEFVEGTNLEEMLKNGKKFSESEACDIISQVADGLEAARSLGVVHRDVKPANIIISNSGVVKIVDFGLSKDLNSNTKLTKTGQLLGTPVYMSPELFNGLPASNQSDIYSLGITLYEMVTGTPPFSAPSPMALMVKHCNEPLPNAKLIAPALSDEICGTLAKMTSKAPAQRYENFTEIGKALRKNLPSDGLRKTAVRNVYNKCVFVEGNSNSFLNTKQQSYSQKSFRQSTHQPLLGPGPMGSSGPSLFEQYAIILIICAILGTFLFHSCAAIFS